jgi:hypothetical protein
MPPIDPRNTEGLYLMLGEMKADLRFLVTERSVQGARIDALEDHLMLAITKTAERVSKLETFRTQIGVLTVAAGISSPVIVTFIARKLGFM